MKINHARFTLVTRKSFTNGSVKISISSIPITHHQSSRSSRSTLIDAIVPSHSVSLKSHSLVVPIISQCDQDCHNRSTPPVNNIRISIRHTHLLSLVHTRKYPSAMLSFLASDTPCIICAAVCSSLIKFDKISFLSRTIIPCTIEISEAVAHMCFNRRVCFVK